MVGDEQRRDDLTVATREASIRQWQLAHPREANAWYIARRSTKWRHEGTPDRCKYAAKNGSASARAVIGQYTAILMKARLLGEDPEPYWWLTIG